MASGEDPGQVYETAKQRYPSDEVLLWKVIPAGTFVFRVICACIDTELAGLRFPVKVAWAQLEEVPPLLGRTDVFDHFDVTFQQC